MPRGPLEVVVWLDHIAFADSDWHEVVDQPSPATLHSVGWVVHEDDRYLVIAPHIDPDDGQVSGAITILKGVIAARHSINDPTKVSV